MSIFVCWKGHEASAEIESSGIFGWQTETPILIDESSESFPLQSPLPHCPRFPLDRWLTYEPVCAMMTRKIPPFFAASASPLLIATLHLLFTIFTISADAALTVNVRDRGGNPLSSVNVQIFPGTLDPDGNVEPVKPPQPRGDGLVGFVTNQQGRVTVDLPAGQYSVVAFSSSSGRVSSASTPMKTFQTELAE